jgi:hypothetical protein
MSEYAETRRRTAEKMGADAQCIACGETAAWATLSDHGGRCFACYMGYCRAPFEQLQRSESAESIRAQIAAMGRRLPR